MKYSFVIPTYNNKVLLKNTLEALNYQGGYGRYEVIVADDGSSDNTCNAIKGINRNYDLRYFYLERCVKSSRARTRNHGWKRARGEIVIFIDSDIIVRPDYLFELDRCFSMNENIAVIGNRLLLDEAVSYEDITSCGIFRENYFDSRRPGILEYRHFLFEITSYNINANRYPWTHFYSCNAAVPKKWLDITGGFDENFKGWGMEDIELGYALSRKNVPIIIDSKLEVLHQKHEKKNIGSAGPENMTKPEADGNIRYFLKKHPDALNMPEEQAVRFLKGEASDDGNDDREKIRYIGIDFKMRQQEDPIKNLILNTLAKPKTIPVINDYIENTDLDIWIQLPKEKGNSAARYYPMSKRIDQKEAEEYLKNEMDKQKKKGNDAGMIKGTEA